jgi:uncharacterized protein
MHQVSESLADRLSIVELTTFLASELKADRQDALWLCGGFPRGGILNHKSFGLWQKDYLQLLVQRDLPLWGLPAKPQATDRLLKMVAAVHGRQWNASQIGGSLGISHSTVNNYMEYLEGAFLVRCLRPYQTNLKKRLVKHPKYYWRDTGLLHALLNVSSMEQLLSQYWVGSSWEGFVIEQIINHAAILDFRAASSYMRTSDNYEIDLVLDFRGKLWAIDAKLTSQPGRDDLIRLNRAADLIGANRRVLISKARESIATKDNISCSLAFFLEHLSKS